MKTIRCASRLLLALLVTFIIAGPCQAANVCEGVYGSGDSARTASARYMVSMLLQRKDAAAVVKLVQSSALAPNAADAEMLVRNDVKAQYPDYIVIDTLSSALEPPVQCERPADTRSPFMRTAQAITTLLKE